MFRGFLGLCFFNGFVTLRIILFAQLLFYDFDMICLHYFYDSFTKANAKLEMAGEGGGGGDRGTFMYYVTPLSFQACTATMDSDCSSLARRARRARKARSCNLLAILAHLAKPKELEDCCS